jgi:predicted porin
MFNTKKTLMAASVALAIAAPLAVQAQTSVQVYGRLYPQINHYKLSGATAAGTPGSSLSTRVGGADVTGTNMESPNARLGFRGSEDLGAGLKAIFQLEMSFGVDNGVIPTNTLFGRDTFVGLAGGFGTIRLGKMDTVYKSIGDTLSFLGISSGNFMATSNILSKPGIGGSGTSFHLRRDNSIIYETPEFAGFQGLFDYSLGEFAGDFKRNSLISTGVKYENGPIYAAIAHERHRNMFGASSGITSPLGLTGAGTTALRNSATTAGGVAIPGASSTDKATRLTLQYKITPDTRVEANIAKLDFNETGTGTFRSYNTRTWALGVEHKMGPVTLASSYGQASAGSCRLAVGPCSTSGLDGKMFNIGAGYSLSKRTLLYTVYSRLNNGSSARYSNVVQAPDPVAGQDTNQFAVGVSHSF